MKIDELEGRNLNLAVSKALGYQCYQFIGPDDTWYQLFAPAEVASRSWAEVLCGALLDPDKWDVADLVDAADDLPQWATDIAQAWELDSEGWLWRFGDDAVTTGLLQVDLEVPAEGDEPPDELRLYVRLADFPSKAQAYATARCRAFLKAKGADDD